MPHAIWLQAATSAFFFAVAGLKMINTLFVLVRRISSVKNDGTLCKEPETSDKAHVDGIGLGAGRTLSRSNGVFRQERCALPPRNRLTKEIPQWLPYEKKNGNEKYLNT